MEYDEGLVQGSPISSSWFSFTIDGVVKKADEKLANVGGCARFGMDDGYLVEPPGIVFEVLAEFARDLKKDSDRELNINKCKMYNVEEGACKKARRHGLIPDELQHLHEGSYVNWSGDVLRGILVFNVSIGAEKYVQAITREKAAHVVKTMEAYVQDLGDEYPQEL
jgi:hypothetical protein